MENKPSPFNGSVLVTTDFSEISFSAFPYALDEAKARSAEVRLLNILEGFSVPLAPFNEFALLTDTMESIRKEVTESSTKKLMHLGSAHFPGVILSCEVIQSFQSTGNAIVEYATSNRCGLIVIAGHGHGFISRTILGSVAERVMRHALCPILIVPCGEKAKKNPVFPPYRHVVVTTDCSEASKKAFPYASFEAKRSEALLTLIKVEENLFAPELICSSQETIIQNAQKIQEEYKRQADGKFYALKDELDFKDAELRIIKKEGTVGHSVSEFARSTSADLIVLASLGAGNSLTWLGGTAERIIRQAPCPVLVIPKNSRE